MIRRGVMAGIVLGLLGWNASAVGRIQSDDPIFGAAYPQSTADSDTPLELEPMTVTGERTRRAVQIEMYAVQDQAYALFNELNTDDEYDIICREERPRGAKFSHRTCKARFHREAESKAADDYLLTWQKGFGVFKVDRQELDRKYAHNKELMADLAHSHPEFLELLQKQHALRQEFEAKGGVVRSAIGSSE